MTQYIATVEWIRPSGGGVRSGKLLSLDLSEIEDTEYVATSIDISDETFLFRSGEEAAAFKTQVEKRYAQNPRYFVIDDNGNEVLDDDGEPTVAWEPFVTIAPASVDDWRFAAHF